jgi:hypothetical protein
MPFKIGPYTIIRAAIIPYETESQTGQVWDVDGDGGVVVTEQPYVERFMKVTIRGTNEEMEAVKGFIETGVRFKAVPFNVTDDWNTIHLVRYWGDKVTKKLIAPGICEMELLLRKEI